MVTRVLHSGDLGDIVLFLPTARSMGDVELWIDDRPWTAKISGARFEILKPLLEAQSYITSVHAGTPDGDFFDASKFRDGGHPFGDRLTDLQARWAKVSISHEPWLSAPPSFEFEGRVICHRSPRYNSPFFPWREVGEYYGDRLTAVGSRAEAEELGRAMGRELEFTPTKDFLELASAIVGAGMFIGNQSSPMSVAAGLGVEYIQEVCLWTPDCLYPERTGSLHCIDGGIPGISEPWKPAPEIDENSTPPGGWKWVDGERSGSCLGLAEAVRKSKLAKENIIMQNVERVPSYFFRQDREGLFGLVEEKLLDLSSFSA